MNEKVVDDIQEEMEAEDSILPQEVHRTNILDDVARSDAFFKSQQRGEKDLTFDEKRVIAKDLMEKNVTLFLQRFWKHISLRDVPLFEVQDDYEVNYYLAEIRKSHDKKKNDARIKNRRYEALKKMVSEGSYFSDTEMKERNPLLYERNIGQYLTDDERIAMRKGNEPASFSAFLMEQIDKNYICSLARQQEEQEENEDQGSTDEDEIDEEEEEEDDDDDVVGNNGTRLTMSKQLPDEEKKMLRDEFTNIMFESFLSGNDKGFDYSTVDNNAEYDSIREREVDEEEKYFDEESPETLSE